MTTDQSEPTTRQPWPLVIDVANATDEEIHEMAVTIGEWFREMLGLEE